MTQHGESAPNESLTEARVALRSPAELADALPYLLGFHPDNSLVVVALHGRGSRFGARMRLDIPLSSEEWPALSGQLAARLVVNARMRGGRPDGALVFLCQDPESGDTGQSVAARLRPLAQQVRIACGEFEVPVYEALCISDGRYWSYCCPDSRCCPAEGSPLGVPGTSAMAAAAAYAGIQVRGSLKGMEARLAPLGPPLAVQQERALDAAAMALVPRMLGEADRDGVCTETIDLAELLVDRLRQTTPDPVRRLDHSAPARVESVRGMGEQTHADVRDDALLSHEEAAALIVGLQDRVTRDHAAEWMEGEVALPALRLWRALARRCVGAYADHAVAPLTLAGWVAWSSGDDISVQVALGRALRTDPHYLFARLLHQACNEGLDPEPLRRCMRQERARRTKSVNRGNR